MEYHKGARTLNSLILSATNPYYGNVTKSLNLFEQVVSAIKFCQSSNPPIVRRDINPKNILVLPDDTICLIDFGICQVQDGTIITLVDENVGARNYTSPECEAGNEESIHVYSDIYSASKVL
jgi:serine/threonine protein kinase